MNATDNTTVGIRLKADGSGFIGPMRQAREELDDLKDASAGADKSLGVLNRNFSQTAMSSKQTAAALRMVPAQLTDIVTSLQGGQAPLTVFLQQGGQLRDMFGSSSAAARALGGYVLSLISPITLAGTAVIGLALALYQGSQQSVALNRALAVTGNYAGATASTVERVSRSIEDSGLATASAARNITTAVINSGRVSQAAFDGASKFAAAYAAVTRKSAEESVSATLKIFDSPSKGAAELNRQYHFLTAATYQHIAALEKQGRVSEAQNLLSAEFQSVAKDTVENLGWLQQGWRAVAGAASWAWDSMLGLGRDQTLDQSLDNLNQRIAKLQANLKVVPGGALQLRLKELIDTREALLENIRLEKRQADSQAANADREQKRIDAYERYQSLVEQAQGNEGKLASEIKRVNEERRKGLITEEQAQQSIKALHKLYGDHRKGLNELNKAEAELMRLREQEADAYARSVAAANDAYRANQAIVESAKAEVQQFGLSRIAVEQLTIKKREAMLVDMQWADFQLSQRGQVDADLRNRIALLQNEIDKRKEALTWMQQAAGNQAKSQLDQIGVAIDQKSLTDAERKRDDFARGLDKGGLDKAAVDGWLAQYDQMMARMEASNSDAWEGMRVGIKQYAEDARNAFSVGEAMGRRAFQGIEDAVVKFVTTGKVSLRDFVSTALAEFARLQAQKALGALASVALSAWGASSAAPSGSYSAAEFSAYYGGARATGGPVAKGAFYKVNERGPELLEQDGDAYLMMGGKGGRVIPLSAAATTTSGGGGVVINSSVNIAIQQDGSAKVESKVDGTGQYRELARQIENGTRQVIQNELRPGGLLHGRKAA
ncbi:phage tail length tape measure family protein [Chitinimonas taiwanensis]|uniref:phage tail length tape measure family protein n=1 Tax=Chitinimonas taiwanensis TaxID=240412 RepID=UPI0035B0EE20